MVVLSCLPGLLALCKLVLMNFPPVSIASLISSSSSSGAAQHPTVPSLKTKVNRTLCVQLQHPLTVFICALFWVLIKKILSTRTINFFQLKETFCESQICPVGQGKRYRRKKSIKPHCSFVAQHSLGHKNKKAQFAKCPLLFIWHSSHN